MGLSREETETGSIQLAVRETFPEIFLGIVKLKLPARNPRRDVAAICTVCGEAGTRTNVQSGETKKEKFFRVARRDNLRERERERAREREREIERRGERRRTRSGERRPTRR